jgi:predicted dehydrogenase
MNLRVGIVGAGADHASAKRGQVWLRFFTTAGAEVKMVYDPVRANAERAAAFAPGCRVTTDWQEFLDTPLGAAVIASPVPFHARQAADCLDRGMAVLSEVSAATNLDDAKRLARAASQPGRLYMLSANFRFRDEVELLKRMADDGRFGQIYYAEGSYLHDCRTYCRDPDGSLTWRGEGQYGVYIVHPLAPLLYILQDRVAQVSALSHSRAIIDAKLQGDFNYTLLMRTAKGATLYLREDSIGPRPKLTAYTLLHGTRGAFESARGLGDEAKVAVEEAPGSVETWRPLRDFAAQYIPERLNPPADIQQYVHTHGTMEYWTLQEFLASVQQRRTPAVDVFQALDIALPAIMAVESVRHGGAVVEVPDPRSWV